LRIGIAFDLLPADRAAVGGPDDRFEEFDKPETVAAIADVIRGEGHDVSLLGDGPEFLRKVLDDPPDFVFNIAEGQGVGRCREARVPAVLEMLGIPYSGSDPLTLSAALDKDVAKRLVSACGVNVPEGILLSNTMPMDEALDEAARLGRRVGYPLILKPAYEGSSKGIRGRCLADDHFEAEALYRRLREDYEQPVLVERFIAGMEITVGVIGNGDEARSLGMLAILPKEPTDRFVYSLDVKRDWLRRVDYRLLQFSGDTLDGIATQALSAHRALGCRDVARIDFRLKGEALYFIEANPLPGLAPGTSDLVILAEKYGLSHGDLIRRILNTALERVGLLPAGAVAS
jgi:D-alanine-D-alanine ligase